MPHSPSGSPFGNRVRVLRRERGLTQAELASRAQVSRQLIGAVENGRHLPRVDAAVALADALDVSVESLLATPAAPLQAVVGEVPPPGVPVRVGRVGARVVCAPALGSPDGWATADAVLREDGLEHLGGGHAGAVVVGCDPALGLAARLVTERSTEGVLAVGASTAAALDALEADRAHAAVVHGPAGSLPSPSGAVHRHHFASWEVGLAASVDAPAGWWRTALQGGGSVVQRESGAGSQAAFERAAAATGGGRAPGPVVDGHLEAAWLAARSGAVAVTIEPAARAVGLRFHPLELHVAELWITSDHADEPAVRRIAEALASTDLRRRLRAIGGYHLDDHLPSSADPRS